MTSLLRENWRGIALVAVGWGVIVGVLVVLLIESQARGRQTLDKRFEARAVIASRFLSTYVADLVVRQRDLAERRLSGARVSASVFGDAAVDSGYEAAVLLDARGRLIQSAPPTPP